MVSLKCIRLDSVHGVQHLQRIMYLLIFIKREPLQMTKLSKRRTSTRSYDKCGICLLINTKLREVSLSQQITTYHVILGMFGYVRLCPVMSGHVLTGFIMSHINTYKHLRLFLCSEGIKLDSQISKSQSVCIFDYISLLWL